MASVDSVALSVAVSVVICLAVVAAVVPAEVAPDEDVLEPEPAVKAAVADVAALEANSESAAAAILSDADCFLHPEINSSAEKLNIKTNNKTVILSKGLYS